MNSPERQIRFKLNGRAVTANVRNHENLVDLLKRFDLHGARESCGQGLCGCCSVIVDGAAVSGCLTLALLVDGLEVSTVEGLDAGQKQAIALAFFQGLSHSELSRQLRQPLGTVKSWVRRGLERLRDCLDRAGVTR